MKKHIVSFVIGILLLGIGCGYFTFEMLEFDYLDEADPNISIESQKKVYEVGPNQQYEIEVKDGKLKVVFDDNSMDTMEITTYYPKDYINLHYEEEKEYYIEKELTYHFYDITKAKDARKAVEKILENISKKRFYNYEKTFVPIVEVRIKEENLKYVKLDKSQEWND